MSMEQIARDIREGTFPRMSAKTIREQAMAKIATETLKALAPGIKDGIREGIARSIAMKIEAAATNDLTVAPGEADLSFGALLDEMVRHMFVRAETLDPDAPHRHCVRCSQCDGDDQHRSLGQRPSITNVRHKPDCSLGKHLPRIRAMASKDVT